MISLQLKISQKTKDGYSGKDHLDLGSENYGVAALALSEHISTHPLLAPAHILIHIISPDTGLHFCTSAEYPYCIHALLHTAKSCSNGFRNFRRSPALVELSWRPPSFPATSAHSASHIPGHETGQSRAEGVFLYHDFKLNRQIFVLVEHLLVLQCCISCRYGRIEEI